MQLFAADSKQSYNQLNSHLSPMKKALALAATFALPLMLSACTGSVSEETTPPDWTAGTGSSLAEETITGTGAVIPDLTASGSTSSMEDPGDARD